MPWEFPSSSWMWQIKTTASSLLAQEKSQTTTWKRTSFRWRWMCAADLREVVDLQLLFVSLDSLSLFSRLSLLLQLLHRGVVQLSVDLLRQLLCNGLGWHRRCHNGAAPQDGVGGLLHHILYVKRKPILLCLFHAGEGGSWFQFWWSEHTWASAPRFFWALILSASLLAISSFWMFPAEVGPRPGRPPPTAAVAVVVPAAPAAAPGADRSFTLFLELNMLSICSSIWEGRWLRERYWVWV